MKRFFVLGLMLLSVAAGTRSVDAQRTTAAYDVDLTTAVGGVVVSTMNYFIFVLLALFVLEIAFFLFRKRSSVISSLTPMLTRLIRL